MTSRNKDYLLLVGLVVAGVTLRLGFQHLPNFAPVAAIALFSGYVMRNRLLAMAAPLLVMLISDAQLGGYHPVVMVAVYSCLTLPVLLRAVLRSYLPMEERGIRLASAVGLVGCSLAMSLVFFLVTNFAVWLAFDLYPRSAAGLMVCYGQALPFFRYTLGGDLFFATALFGGFAVYLRLARSVAREDLIASPVAD